MTSGTCREETAADRCQKLCLLDRAVESIKANSSDHRAACVMYNDAVLYLGKLKALPGAQNVQPISEIAKKVRVKL